MAAKRKTTKKTTTKKTTAKKTRAKAAPRPKGAGTVALVVRVPPAALDYIDQAKGDRPRTRFVRDVMAKGDARLGKLLGVE